MINSSKKIAVRIASILFIAFLTILPLYLENAYFNITKAKARVYLFVAIVFLPFVVYSFIAERKKYTVAKITVSGFCLISLSVVSLVSSVINRDFINSFIGRNGWYIGAFTICSLTAFYIFLSSNLEYRQTLWLPFIAVCDIIFIIAIIQSAGVNIFSLRSNISGNIFFYISTVGNVNRFAGFVCLVLPLFTFFYLSSDDKKSRLIYLVSFALCVSCGILCCSDSFLLGIGFSLFFAIFYIFRSYNRITDFLFLLLISAFALILIDILPCFNNLRLQATGLSAVAFRPTISVLFAVTVLVAYIVLLLIRNKVSSAPHVSVTAVILIVLAVLATVFLVYSFRDFSDEWGSHRGMIWRVSLEKFKSFTLIKKLFGTGPESLEVLLAEVSVAFEMRCLTAHSELIQTLLSMGIIGTICYLGAWCTLFIKFFKGRHYSDDSIAFYIPAFAYFAQALVNSATTLNLCVLCIICAASNSYIKNNN